MRSRQGNEKLCTPPSRDFLPSKCLATRRQHGRETISKGSGMCDEDDGDMCRRRSPPRISLCGLRLGWAYETTDYRFPTYSLFDFSGRIRFAPSHFHESWTLPNRAGCVPATRREWADALPATGSHSGKMSLATK